MTVKELIAQLEQIQNKSQDVGLFVDGSVEWLTAISCLHTDGDSVLDIDEWRSMFEDEKKHYNPTLDIEKELETLEEVVVLM